MLDKRRLMNVPEINEGCGDNLRSEEHPTQISLRSAVASPRWYVRDVREHSTRLDSVKETKTRNITSHSKEGISGPAAFPKAHTVNLHRWRVLVYQLQGLRHLTNRN